MPPRRPRDGDDERDGPDPSNPSAYEGERDADGLPHGRGRLRLDDEGVWHEGRFVHGARHGRGTLRFPPDGYEPGPRSGRHGESDAERGDAGLDFPVGGDWLAGTFADGVLHGPAVYHSADGSSKKGAYVHGELTGVVEEFDASGALVFRGEYVDGVRHGDGVLRQPDGSTVVSYWHEGAQGCEGIFIYPSSYGVPVDATLRRKVPTKCRGFEGDEKGLREALAKLADLCETEDETKDEEKDQTCATKNTVPSVLFGFFALSSSRRDSFAGEAAFFERHDELGVVRAGSCWARFDEFEGVQAGTENDDDDDETAARLAFVAYRRDDFSASKTSKTSKNDSRLREWLSRSRRAWREPVAQSAFWKDKSPAVGWLTADSPEPLDRSKLELRSRSGKSATKTNASRDEKDGEETAASFSSTIVARRLLLPNDVVGFSSSARVVAPRGGRLPGLETRWRPDDRVFYARELLPGEGVANAEGRGNDASDASKDDASSSGDDDDDDDDDTSDDTSDVLRDATDDDGRAVPAGGVFFFERSDPRFSATLGGFVRADVRAAPSTRRAPFAHPALGVAFALVAVEAVAATASPSQPPDYACGWATRPRSEAGYYHHLRVSPPATVFETPGTADLGRVRVTQHGPWRALWLDGVEQGLAYDASFRADVSTNTRFRHDPYALGFEYVRAMATAAVASAGAAILEGGFSGDDDSTKKRRLRTLCVGLGAGSLPAFLANAFAGAAGVRFRVEAVEIDRAVAAAARDCLGVAYTARDDDDSDSDSDADADADAENDADDDSRKTNVRSFALRLDDAARYLGRLAASGAAPNGDGTESAGSGEDRDRDRDPYEKKKKQKQKQKQKQFALVLLDAYDGKGEIPAHLRGHAFLRDARRALAPGGAVVANCFYGPPGSRAHFDLLAFCEALGGEVEDARAVRVRLVKVEGQESNVVVVAEATELGTRRAGAFGGRAAVRDTLAAAAARMPAEARAALCDGDRLEVSGELTGVRDTREADGEAPAVAAPRRRDG